MKKLFIIIASIFIFTSCGEIGEEASNLEVNVFSNRVVNATDEGILVQDPATEDTEKQITLINGFFEFYFTFVNKNNVSVVIENFTAEVLDGEAVVDSAEFVSQAYFLYKIGDLTNPGPSDPKERYFAHLDPNATDSDRVFLGGNQSGKFYVDGLERGESGAFRYTIRVTLRGFLTGVTRAGIEATAPNDKDPYEDDDGYFERIVVFQVSSRSI